jgi:hypothetical protein
MFVQCNFVLPKQIHEAPVPKRAHEGVVCSGLHNVVLWDVWPVLLDICAWRLSSSLPGVSHHCLSILQIARCLSRALLLGGSYSSGLVTCRCLAPAYHAWLVEVCRCMTLSCKHFLLDKKKKKRAGMEHRQISDLKWARGVPPPGGGPPPCHPLPNPPSWCAYLI